MTSYVVHNNFSQSISCEVSNKFCSDLNMFGYLALSHSFRYFCCALPEKTVLLQNSCSVMSKYDICISNKPEYLANKAR